MNLSRFMLFVVLFSLVFALSSNLVSAGCCLDFIDNPDGSVANSCTVAASAEECCGSAGCASYNAIDTDCSACNSNAEGCCVNSCGFGSYADCRANASSFVPGDLDCTDNSHDASDNCDAGCCVGYSDGIPGFCQPSASDPPRGLRRDCIITGQFTEMIFTAGVSSDDCFAVCTSITPGGNLNGHVYYGTSPIINAVVSVSDFGISDITDSAGYYEIISLPVGSYSIVASASGYTPQDVSINIASNLDTTVDFSLATVSGFGSMRGRITNEAAAPIQNAYISCARGFEQPISSYSNSSGHYIILNMPPGSYSCTASNPPTYQPYTKTALNVAAGAALENNYILSTTPQAGKYCGNDIVEKPNDENFFEECDSSADTTNEGADLDCENFCKSDCRCARNCLDAGFFCADFSYQCTIAGGSLVEQFNPTCETPANSQFADYGCCNSPISPVPDCHDGTLTNNRIGFGISSSGNMCKCGTSFYDTSASSPQSQGYCCSVNNAMTYQTAPCSTQLGRIRGYISSASGQRLDGALISVGSYSTHSAARQIPNSNLIEHGYYEIDIPTGTYDINASLWPDYYPASYQAINVAVGQVVIRDFVLNPRDTSCDGTLPAPAITLKNIKGKAAINITWSQQCSDLVYLYHLYRNGNYIGALSKALTYLEDHSLQWNFNYTYLLNATTNSIHGYNYSSATKNTGNALCADKPGDEELCINGSTLNKLPPLDIRAKCNDNNLLVLIENCTISNSVCLAYNDLTWCSANQDCPSLGVPLNYLGLYYTDQYDDDDLSCTERLSANERRYCYLDYSPFPADSCLNCSQNDFCYDYKSEDACLRDNCYYGPSRGYSCEWADSYYSEFGKGFCYAFNYTGTDYCNLCNEDNEYFFNYYCTPGICKKLGSCYSDPSQKNCLSCSSSTTCSDYKDMESCIANSNGFSIPNDICADGSTSTSFSFSDDICSLGSCKWDNVGNTCYKDADDNSLDDCENKGDSCKTDNKAPVTSIINKPSFINTIDRPVRFSALDSAPSTTTTYFCLALSDSISPNELVCCPNELINNNELVLPGEKLALLDGKEGMLFMSFYSRDSYNNTEAIKTEPFYLDTKKPSINLSWLISNSSSPAASNLDIWLNVSEHSSCSAILSINNLNITPTQLYKTPINPNTNYRINYSQLNDGFYTLLTRCIDGYSNNQEQIDYIYIDRVHGIFAIKPNITTINASYVLLSIKTYDKDYCRYRQLLPTASAGWQPFNPGYGLAGEGIPDGRGNYDYNATLQLSTASYVFIAECFDNENFAGISFDSTNIIFTVDLQAPITAALYENSTGRFIPVDENRYYAKSTMLKINCSDNALGPPREFGCSNRTYYCISASPPLCTPDITNQSQRYSAPRSFFALSQSNSYALCSRALDNGGNLGLTACSTVKIDGTAPFIQITSPANNSLFGSPKTITLLGNWIDISSLSRVNIRWQNASAAFKELNATLSGSGSGAFTAQISLFNGPNTITVTAYDAVGNSNSSTIKLISDNVPPLISNILVKDSINSPSPFAEYRTNIRFNATISDQKWSNVPLAVVSVKAKHPVINTGCASDYNFTLIPHPQKNTSFSLVSSQCLEVGNYSVNFIALDAFGNRAEKALNLSVRDTTPPKINITIYDQSTPVRVVTWDNGAPKTYIIDILSDTFLSQISSFTFSFTAPSGQQIVKDVDAVIGSGISWSGTITIAGSDFLSLNNVIAFFHVNASDLNGVTAGDSRITSGRNFTIDTVGPAAPTIFDPTAKSTYTSQNKIYFTGMTEPSLRLELYKSTETSNILMTQLWQLAAAINSYPAMLPTNWTLGKTHLLPFRFFGNNVLHLVDIDRIFNDSVFMRFEKNARYNQIFYNITNVVFAWGPQSRPYYNVTFDPPLQSAITDLYQNIYLYSQHVPGGWFDSWLELSPGINYFYAIAHDANGNIGANSSVYTVFYDSNTPYVAYTSPEDGSYTDNNRTTLFAVIRDDIGINQSSLRLAFNGSLFSCTGIVYCSLNTEATELNVTYTYPTALPDLREALYHAFINVSDNAGNLMQHSWSFTIDVDIPKKPNITVIDGALYDFKWYAGNIAPQIDILFSADETINLTRVVLDKPGFQSSASFSQDSSYPNIYHLSAYSPALSEGSYMLKVYARKLLPEAIWSGEGLYIYGLVIDQTSPQASLVVPRYTASNIITASLRPNEPLSSISISGGIENPPLNIAPSNIASFILNLSSADGAKEITASITDIAGNTGSASNTTIIDTVQPVISTSITNPPLLYGRFTTQSTFTVQCSCSDELSGCSPNANAYYREASNPSWTRLTSPTITIPPSGTEKTILFNCSQSDNALNYNSATAEAVLIRGAPSIRFISPAYNYTTDDPFTEFKVATSHPASCRFSWSQGFEVPDDFMPDDASITHSLIRSLSSELGITSDLSGPYTYYVRCTSNYGPYSSTAIGRITVDKSQLVIEEAKSVLGTYLTESFAVPLVVRTNKPSFCKYSNRTPGDEPWQSYDVTPHNFSSNFTTNHYNSIAVNSNGYYVFGFYCRDYAGSTAYKETNFTVDVGSQFNITGKGILPPLVSGATTETSPLIYAETNKRAVCKLRESGASWHNMTYDGPFFTPDRVMYHSYIYLTQNLDNGAHDFIIECTSRIPPPQTMQAALSFIVDNQPPAQPLISLPQNSSYFNTDFAVSGTAAADSAVIEIGIDNSAIGFVNLSTQLSFSSIINIAPLSDGRHQLSAYAYDFLGNGPGQPSNITFFVDTVSNAPSISALPAYSSSATISISGSAEPRRSSQPSLVKIYSYGIGILPADSSLVGTAPASDNGSFSVDVLLPAGRNYIYATQIDSLQNPESPASNTVSLFIDLEQPQIYDAYPDGAMLYGKNIIIKASIRDNYAVNRSSITLAVDSAAVSLFAVEANGIVTVSSSPITLADGQHTVRLSVKDLSSNSAEAVWSFESSGCPSSDPASCSLVYIHEPIVSINSQPADLSSENFINQSSFVVSFVYDSGINLVNLTLARNNIVSALTGSAQTDATSFSHDFSLAEGSYRLSAAVNATASLQRRDVIAIAVDTTLPIIKISGIVPLNPSGLSRLFGNYSEANLDSIYVAGERLSNSEIDTARKRFEHELMLVEGLNTITAEIIDMAGNRASDVNAFFLNSSSPHLELDDVPRYIRSLPLEVSGSTIPNSPVKIIVNKAPPVTVMSDSSGRFERDVSGLADQLENVINVSVTNNIGLTSTRRLFVVYDTRGPSLASNVPQGAGSFAMLSVALADVSGIDQGSIELKLNGNIVQHDYNALSGVVSYGLSRLVDGNYNVHLAVRDILGNSATISWSFTLDSRAPLISLIKPPAGFANSTIPLFRFGISGPVTEIGIPVLSYGSSIIQMVKVPGSSLDYYPAEPLVHGATYRLEMDASYTNNRGVLVTDVIVDTLKPIVVIRESELPPQTSSRTVDVSGDYTEQNLERIVVNRAILASENIAPSSFTYRGLVLHEGNNTINVEVKDKAGNAGYDSYTVFADFTPPAIHLSEPRSNSAYGSSEVQFSIHIDDSLPVRVSVFANGVKQLDEAPVMANGSLFGRVLLAPMDNTIIVNAADSVGNSASQTLTEVYYDNNAPSLNYIKLNSVIIADGAYTNDKTPSFTVSLADDTLIKNATLLIDNNPAATVQISSKLREFSYTVTSELADAGHLLSVIAVDKFNNTGRYDYNFIVDISIPTLLSYYPEAGQVIGSASPRINLSFDEPVSVYDGRLDSAPINFTAISPASFYYGASLLADRQHILSFKAVRQQGNPLTEAISFVVDTTPPSVRVLSVNNILPSSQIIVANDTPVVKVSYNDQNIKSLTFDSDISYVKEPTSQAGTIETANVRLHPGSNTIYITALDMAGNSNQTSVVVIYDSTNPLIDIDRQNIINTTLIGGRIKTRSSQLTISGTYIEDNLRAISSPSHTVRSLAIDSANRRFNITVNLRIMAGSELENNITLAVEDLAGSFGYDSVTVYYDSKPPVINMTIPQYMATTSQYPLVGIATDEPSACNLSYSSQAGPWRQPMAATSDMLSHDSTLAAPLAFGASTRLTIGCLDLLGNYASANYNIYVDDPDRGTPNITNVLVENSYSSSVSAATHNYLIIRGLQNMTAITQLSVIARDDNPAGVRCKYGTALDYNSMIPFEDYGSFSLNPESGYFLLDDATSSLFYIICEDPAARRSAPFIANITVDLSMGIAVMVIKPLDYTNLQNPEIMVTTLNEAAECTIQHESGPTTYPWRDDMARVNPLMKRILRRTSPATSLYNYSIILSSDDDNLEPLNDNTAYGFRVSCDPDNYYLNGNEVVIEFTTDYTSPSLAITSPLNNSQSLAPNIDVSGSTEPNARIAIASPLASLTLNAADDGSFAASIALQNGTNRITVSSKDIAGNMVERSVFVTFITEGPSVLSITPSSGSFRRLHNVTAILRQYGNDGIDLANSGIELFDQSGAPITGNLTNNNNNALYFIIGQQLADGTYTIKVSPVGGSGKFGASAFAAITINSNLPDVTIISPIPGSTLASRRLNFSAVINTYGQNISTAHLMLNRVSNSIKPYLVQEAANILSYRKEHQLLEGINNFSYLIVTSHGDIKDTGSQYVRVDTTGPIPRITIK